MDERQIAYNAMRCHARTIVDKEGMGTLGRYELANGFASLWHGRFDVRKVMDAIINWVVCAGYDENGEFKVIMSDSKM